MKELLKILNFIFLVCLLTFTADCMAQNMQQKKATLMLFVKETSITIRAGTTLNVDGDQTIAVGGSIDNAGRLEVGGDWSNLGTFNKRTGIVVMDDGESDPQSISGENYFNDLTIENPYGVSILASGGTQKVYATLTLDTGEFDVTGDSLILLSDSIGTARIAEVKTGASMKGDFTMQRYIDGPDGWRLISSPVFGAILEGWNDDFAMSGFAGSDDPASNFISVWTYDETVLDVLDSGYVEPASTSDVLNPGQGFMCWIGETLGDSIKLTLNLTDSLTSGTQTIALTYSNSVEDDTHDGWNLVGNPFPSDIYWDSVALSAFVTPFAYVYDPGTQAYLSFGQTSDTTIPSHQGFWVKMTSGATMGTITIEEKDKAADGDNFYKMQPASQIRMRLSGYGSHNTAQILFKDNASETYDWQYDAFKLPSPNPNYPNLSSITSDNLDMMINSFPTDYQNFNIPLRVFWSDAYPPTVTDFNLNLHIDELPTLLPSVCLEDLVTGSFTDLSEGAQYSFSTPYIANAPPRFILHGLASECVTSLEDKQSDGDIEDLITVSQTIDKILVAFNLSKSEKVMIEVRNILGQNIIKQSYEVYQETVMLNVPNSAFGIYFIRIATEDKTVVKKIAF